MSPCDERHTVEYARRRDVRTISHAPDIAGRVAVRVDGISSVDGLLDMGTPGLCTRAAEGRHQTRTLMNRGGDPVSQQGQIGPRRRVDWLSPRRLDGALVPPGVQLSG